MNELSQEVKDTLSEAWERMKKTAKEINEDLGVDVMAFMHYKEAGNIVTHNDKTCLDIIPRMAKWLQDCPDLYHYLMSHYHKQIARQIWKGKINDK